MPQRFIAAVDVGASNVRVAIANPDGEIEARRAFPYPGGAPDEALAKVGRAIDELARGVWVGAKVAAIGVVLPGAVDPAAGVVSTPANLPGWGDVAIGDLLGKPRGIPVAVENDANAAALGECWLGAARGLDDFVFIALGTGIGAGMVLGGSLRRGAHFLAGEVAYFPMTREHLRQADWRHCLEGSVGGRAIAAAAVDIVGADAKPGDLFDAAERGDEGASAWLRETQDYLAMAVADIAALLDPQAVVFGGGVMLAQGERLLAPVREAALRCLPARPAILLTQLAGDAQILGAVRLALDRLEEPA